MQKNSFREILLVNIFLLNLFASSISNYLLYSFLLKILSLLMMISVIYFDFKENYQFKDEIFNGLKKIFLYGFFITLYFSVTLIYSSNSFFGTLKILNIVINSIPLTAAFYYLIISFNILRYKIFITSITTISVLTSVAVILLYPFDHSEVYNFSIERWSHVIYGRFISSAFIILFIMFFIKQEKKKILLYSIPLPIIFFSLYLTGLRAALLGVILFTLFYIIFYLKDLAKKKLNYIVFVIAAVIIWNFIFYSNIDDKIFIRYRFLSDIENLEFKGDPAINDRLQSFELSCEIYKKNAFFGTGFGGFRNYEGNKQTEYLKYPHNIFLEFAVELGIPGILLLFFLLFLIFKSAKKISIHFLLFFLFAFWLSLFSKDIPSNALLWIGLGLTGINKELKNRWMLINH